MSKIITIVGASGSGKNTLVSYIKDVIPELVSHSTRPMRPGEQEGVTYYFVSKEEFDKVELVERVEYAGNFYGLSVKEVEDKLAVSPYVCVIVDRHGLDMLIDRFGHDTVYGIYLKISPETSIQRMRDRGDSEEVISKRMKHAEEDKEFTKPARARVVLPAEGSKEFVKHIFLTLIGSLTGYDLCKYEDTGYMEDIG